MQRFDSVMEDVHAVVACILALLPGVSRMLCAARIVAGDSLTQASLGANRTLCLTVGACAGCQGTRVHGALHCDAGF